MWDPLAIVVVVMALAIVGVVVITVTTFFARRAITVGLKCNATLETLAQGNLGAQQDREPSQPSPDRLHHVATRWISARKH
jgi:hypothetical protein